jgi:hypothetical protein
MQPPEGSRIKIAIAGGFRRTLAIFYLVWCFVDCLVSFAPIEMIPVPKSKCCSSVDMENGNCYNCALRGIVQARTDCPFTIGQWNELEKVNGICKR